MMIVYVLNLSCILLVLLRHADERYIKRWLLSNTSLTLQSSCVDVFAPFIFFLTSLLLTMSGVRRNSRICQLEVTFFPLTAAIDSIWFLHAAEQMQRRVDKLFAYSAEPA